MKSTLIAIIQVSAFLFLLGGVLLLSVILAMYYGGVLDNNNELPYRFLLLGAGMIISGVVLDRLGRRAERTWAAEPRAFDVLMPPER